MPSPFGDAGDVFVYPAAADLQLRADRPVGVLDVQVRPPARAAAEDRVEVQSGGAGVRRDQRVLGHPQMRGLVEGDVVIGELPDEARAGGHDRVVGVGAIGVRGRGVAIYGGVDNQGLGSRGQLIVSIHDPTRHPHLEKGGPHGVASFRKRRQLGEDSPEVGAARWRPRPWLQQSGPQLSWGGISGGDTGCHRRDHQPGPGRAHALQESPPRPPRLIVFRLPRHSRTSEAMFTGVPGTRPEPRRPAVLTTSKVGPAPAGAPRTTRQIISFVSSIRVSLRDRIGLGVVCRAFARWVCSGSCTVVSGCPAGGPGRVGSRAVG